MPVFLSYLSGGASETTLADIENTYMNNRMGIEENRNSANRQARLVYDNGVNEDYVEYLAKEYELQGSLAGRTAEKPATAVTVTVPAGTTKNIRKTVNTTSEKDNAVAVALTEQYIKEGWSKTQIERMLKQQGLL